MGNPKQKWTSEEEEALKAGVAKHGAGKWKNIQRDPEFNPYLFSRSNIDLKWRNMTVNSGEKSRLSKPKSGNSAAPASSVVAAAFVGNKSPAPVPKSNTPASAPAAANPPVGDPMVEDSAKSTVDWISAPRYNGIIFEAISALNDPNGADINAIVSYIEQRHQLPQNFRRQLSSRLRRLVTQEKLEKVHNCYKIKKSSSLGAKTPALTEKDVRHRHVQSADPINSGDTLNEAAVAAAYRVAEAENKSFVAAEAVKEAERVAKLAEDADSLLQLAKEILEKCSRGETVLVV